MIILGLDIAKTTGWALYDTKSNLSSIIAGTLKADGENFEERSANFGNGLMNLIKKYRPHMIGIETPLRMAPMAPKRKMKFMGDELEDEASAGGGINAVISSNQLVGAASGVIGCFQIPFITISSVTWRKSFLGIGTHKGWVRKDWKKAARDRCDQLKIRVTNDDQSDAVGVAFAASGTQMAKMLDAR